jgi:hypothetical protein
MSLLKIVSQVLYSSDKRKRNFEIDNAILKVLNPKLKTLFCLYRNLNPNLPAKALKGGKKWEILFGRKKIDKRSIKRHLKYLLQENRISCVKQEKILC